MTGRDAGWPGRTVLLLVTVLAVPATAQHSYLITDLPGCEPWLQQSLELANDKDVYSRDLDEILHESLETWQAVLLCAGLAGVAALMAVLHKLLRRYVFYDGHLLDTWFDAGADVNGALLACGVAARWAWPAVVTWPAYVTKVFGLGASLFYAVATAAPLFLFSIVIVETRIKSPGAKTFLQVIRARLGVACHVVLVVIAMLINLLIIAMVTTQASSLLAALSTGLSTEVMCVLLAAVTGVLATAGGMGGSLYTAYVSVTLLFGIALAYLTQVFYGEESIEEVYNITKCARAHEDNEGGSAMSFISPAGLVDALAICFCSFSLVFVNQSVWQTGLSAKPGHGVFGLLTGALLTLALPLGIAFALGTAYWAETVRAGAHLISDSNAEHGFLAVLTSQRLWGRTGDFLMFTFLLVATVTTLAGEVLSLVSIILYDIYQTYIAPFDYSPTPETVEGETTLRERKQLRNEAYLTYNRRCAVLRYAVTVCCSVLVLPAGLALLAIGVSLPWLFKAVGVVFGSTVLPVVLAITWHRITAPGVLTGMAVGLGGGVATWLLVANYTTGSEGLSDFLSATGAGGAAAAGSGVALAVGGLVCVLVSLVSGGCASSLLEDEVWERTRGVDNPLVPWTVRYAPDIGAQTMVKGKPHFFTVRRTFRVAERGAYIAGVLLAVLLVLVWPACMLLLGVLSEGAFTGWTHTVVAITAVATAYSAVVPLVWELVAIGRQVYYNRQWSHFGSRLTTDSTAGGSSELSGRQAAVAPRLAATLTSPDPAGAATLEGGKLPSRAQRFSSIEEEEADTVSYNKHLDTSPPSYDSHEAFRWKTFIDIES